MLGIKNNKISIIACKQRKKTHIICIPTLITIINESFPHLRVSHVLTSSSSHSYSQRIIRKSGLVVSANMLDDINM